MLAPEDVSIPPDTFTARSSSANPDGIRATGRHGVLEISIPKRPETTPRKIEIKPGE